MHKHVTYHETEKTALKYARFEQKTIVNLMRDRVFIS